MRELRELGAPESELGASDRRESDGQLPKMTPVPLLDTPYEELVSHRATFAGAPPVAGCTTGCARPTLLASCSRTGWRATISCSDRREWAVGTR